MQTFINWFALLLSIAFCIYGVIGWQSGSVKASSYALNTTSTYSGKKAVALSIVWIVVGLLGTAAFGGHILGIKALAPLYQIFDDIIKSA